MRSGALTGRGSLGEKPSEGGLNFRISQPSAGWQPWRFQPLEMRFPAGRRREIQGLVARDRAARSCSRAASSCIAATRSWAAAVALAASREIRAASWFTCAVS